MNISTEAIHFVLSDLIAKKSQRDGVNFTSAQLAQSINVNRSIVHRLIHPDPDKRVRNPQIETLIKIVEFFRAEGFNIRIDDLLATFKTKAAVDVQAQTIAPFIIEKTVPLYSLDSLSTQQIGTVAVKLAEEATHTIAFTLDEDLKPIFKKGSVFIVDTDLHAENDTLVAAKVHGHHKILIRKFYSEGNKKTLKAFDDSAAIILMPTMQYQILGVVIQVNAKT